MRMGTMKEILESTMDIPTNQKQIKEEIFSSFKVILSTEPNFIRKAKTIICYETHLPFSLGLSEGFAFKVINREQIFIYSEKVKHDHMSSVIKCYGFTKKKCTKVTDKGLVIENSLNTINDIIKIIKSKFGYANLFLLNNANRDHVDMLFTYSLDLRIVSHAATVINVDSIYYPTEGEHKPLFTSEDEYNYLLSKLEDKKMDRMIDAFYYFCLSKENELDKNFNSSIINMQTGFEIFVYYIFNKFIEEGIINKPNGHVSYKNVLEHHIGPKLETETYKFNFEDPDCSLSQYWKYVYSFRNNIVHEGHIISYNDYFNLVKPACDNFVRSLDIVLNEKYPQLNIKIEYSK